MERAFPESCISGAEGHIPALELPDANDRHVLATATRAGAEHIVTKNLKDFPDESLAPFGIIAVNPDDVLSSTFELYPGKALSTLRALQRDYRNPPFFTG